MIPATTPSSFFLADAGAGEGEAFLAIPPRLIAESRTGACRVYEFSRNGRRLIFKCLKPRWRHNAARRTLLRREMDVLSSLNHPNIVRPLGFTSLPGLGEGIVMEHAGEATLDAFMASRPLSRRAAIHIVQQLCYALGYIHSRGIIHRDIKPANILVSADGPHVRIIDFGLSHGTAFADPPFPAGTPGYSPPAQLQEAACPDPSADIYSLGRVMHAMLPRRHVVWHAVAAMCTLSGRRFRPRVEGIVPLLRRSRVVAVAAALLVVAGLSVLLMPQRADPPPTPAAVVAVAPAQPSGDTMASPPAEHLPADAPSAAAPAVQPAPATADEPLETRVYRYASEVAAREFARNLHFIDTLRTPESMGLVVVGHWQWRAGEQVRAWLGSQIPDGSPYIDNMMDLASRTIAAYAADHAAEENAAVARTVHRHLRETGTALGGTTAYSFPVSDDRVERHILNRDGSWTVTVEDVNQSLRVAPRAQ